MTSSSRPVIVGHRGAPLVAPENTMASFLAARRLGAGAVELDVHQSRDGVLVVHHDYLLGWSATGTAAIFDLDADQVTATDAGSWFSAEFADERVPRLDEVLAVDGLDFEVELKTYGPGLVDEVLRVVDRSVGFDRVEFTSGNRAILAELRRRCPAARTGLFTPAREPWMTDEVFEHVVVGLARYSTSEVIHVRAGDITAAIVDQLEELGKTGHANDARSSAEVARAALAGARRLSTDDVAMAVAALDAIR